MNTKLKREIKTAVLGIYALLNAACTNVSEKKLEADWTGTDTIVLDTENTQLIARETAVDSVWYVKLESVEESFVGHVDQVLFGDSTILVVDTRIAKAIFRFDYQGRYLGRMSNLGNGPDEFLSLLGLAELPNGTFALFDPRRQRICIFDESGNMVSSIECPMYAKSVQFIDDETIVFDVFNFRNKDTETVGGHASYLVRDNRMKELYKFGSTDFERDFSYTRHHNMYSYDGVVYCNVNFDDVIYEMGRDGVKAKYLLEIRPDGTANHLPVRTEKEYHSLWHRYNHFSGDFIELKDYTYFCASVVQPDFWQAHLLYSHRTRKPYIMINDFDDPMMSFFGIPESRFGDNCLVSWVSASNVISSVERMSEKTDDPRLRELVSGMSRDDNPVLFFYKVAF
ncbi:MAG: 6-bladed beta-propeller [Bacteroidaceae bacterium]|nr:6-bladed beta-propeller [Bacteroidaceae bacterium]